MMFTLYPTYDQALSSRFKTLEDYGYLSVTFEHHTLIFSMLLKPVPSPRNLISGWVGQGLPILGPELYLRDLALSLAENQVV